MEFLRTKQKKIVTEKGEEVFLRGTAVGGWMNMENFINGFPGTESALKEVMEQRLGKEKTTLFFENMMDNFLNEEDIKFIIEGVEEVEKMHGIWKSLKGEIDDKIYERVLERLTYQIFHAKEWRDQINSYFYRKTMIPDEKGRTIY